MRNTDHTTREYQLLCRRFHLYNSPLLTYNACKKLVSIFCFEIQIFYKKNIVTMGNKLPDNINECFILELGQILLFETNI